MKLSLLKEEFLSKLNLASKFTSSKLISSSVLQGVCLIGEKDIIHLYSTNLNSYYHTSIKTENTHKFKIVLEPKKVSEFLGLVNLSKVEIEIKEKQVDIEAGQVKGEFPLYESGEFPLPPKLDEERQKIKTELLKKSLPMIAFSASSDETRPVLTGVNFVIDEENLRLVSTDGFRLSLLSLDKGIPFSPMIVPSDFLSEIMRMAEEEFISFSFSATEKLLAFYVGQHDIYTRLIEGEYPPFEKVIPTEKKTTITLDSDEFLRNVKLVSIFARETSSVIILKTEKDKISLSPKTGGETNIARQEAKVSGEEQKIAFNFKFLTDFLANVPGKKTIIELLRSDAPALFRKEGVNNFFHIIMPVRIQE